MCTPPIAAIELGGGQCGGLLEAVGVILCEPTATAGELNGTVGKGGSPEDETKDGAEKASEFQSSNLLAELRWDVHGLSDCGCTELRGKYEMVKEAGVDIVVGGERTDDNTVEAEVTGTPNEEVDVMY